MVRLDWWPHPLTTEGRSSIEAPSGDLWAILKPLVNPDDEVVALVDGRLVRKQMWPVTLVSEGQVVQARVIARGGDGAGKDVRSTLLQIAILAAATVALPATGLSGAGLLIARGVTQVGGMLLANALFPPRLPDDEQPAQQFSLSGGVNRARPNEPLTLVLGQHRVYPDLVAAPYLEFGEDGDQYLNQIFDFGLGDLRVTERKIGETRLDLGSFVGVETQEDVDSVTLVSGNVDTIQGADLTELLLPPRLPGNAPVLRTTPGDVVKIAFDVGLSHYFSAKGKLVGLPVQIRFEWRLAGSTASWTQRSVGVSTPNGPDARSAIRRSFSYDVPEGQYDTRVTLRSQVEADTKDRKYTLVANLVAIRTYQTEVADFEGRHPLAVRIKASGQLYGRLDKLNAFVQQLIPVWNGTQWLAGRQTSNPAWIYRAFLIGWRVNGRLVAGLGIDASEIDDDAIKVWGEFCNDMGLRCDLVLQDRRDSDTIMTLIAQCGWASRDQANGQEGVLWEDANRPNTAIVSPANIVAGSFAVAFENRDLADEIVGTYVDRDSDYEKNTIRRMVPGTGVPERPATVNLEGVTSGEQAAKNINQMAAHQFYHQRVLSWDMPLDEGFAIARGDVVGLSHDLIDNGTVGGRLLVIDRNRTGVRLSAPIDGAASIWVWGLDGAVHSTTVSASAYPSARVVLADALPAAPSGVADDPMSYRFMAFADAATVNRVRVVALEPKGNSVQVTARDEIPEYYAARVGDLTYGFIPARGQGLSVGVGLFRVNVLENGTREYVWAKHPFTEVVSYEIRYGLPGQVFNDMVSISEGIVGTRFESRDIPADGEWRFGIVGVTADGLRTTETYRTKTIGQAFPPPPFVLGAEEVFAVSVDAGTVPSAPDDAWTYGNPVAPWGVALQNLLTPDRPVGWRASRRVPLGVVAGDVVEEVWGSPEIVHYPVDRPPAWYRVEVTKAVQAELEQLTTSHLTGDHVVSANDATTGGNVTGDIVTFYRGGEFTSTWGWEGTQWRKLARFIGAELGLFGSLQALNLRVTNADIEGTITAQHIDSDVRNVRPLWLGSMNRSNNNTIWSIQLTENVNGFEYVQGLIRNRTASGWGPWFIPVSSLAVGDATGVPTGAQVGALVVADGNTGSVRFFVWKSAGGTLLYFRRATQLGFQDCTFHDIFGVSDPGSGPGPGPVVPIGGVTAPGRIALSAIAAGHDAVVLSWRAADPPATSYVVERNGVEKFTPTLPGYTDMDVLSATVYTYRVRGVNQNVNGEWSDAVEVTTGAAPDDPPAPRMFGGTAVGARGVTLSWVAPTTGTTPFTYRLERIIVARGASTWTAVASQAGLTYEDSGLTPNTEYRYRVRTENMVGGAPSESAWAATSVTTGREAVRAVRVVVTGQTTIQVGWSVPLGATPHSYQVERATSGSGPWSVAETLSRGGDDDDPTPPDTSVEIAGLTPNSTYYFRVRAGYGATVVGPYSAIVNATTRPTPATTCDPPGNLTANVRSVSRIDLSWDAVTCLVSSVKYALYYKRGTSRSWILWATLAAASRTRNVTGLSAGTKYDFRVKAFGQEPGEAQKETEWSGVVSATTEAEAAPATPSVTFSATGHATASASWSRGAGGGTVTGFSWALSGPDHSSSGTSRSSGGSASFTGLEPESEYTLEVTAHGPGGDASRSRSATTEEEPIEDPATPSVSLTATGQTTAKGTITAGTGGGPVDSYSWTLTGGGETRTGVTQNPVFTGLKPDTYYCISAIAIGSEENSSAAGDCTTTDSVPDLPGRVTGFAVEATGATTGRASWGSPSIGTAPFTYHWRLNDSDGDEVDSGSGSDTSESFSGLDDGELYTVVVYAENATGAGPSRSFSFITDISPPSGAPRNVSSSASPNGTITVGWSAPTGTALVSSYSATITGGLSVNFTVSVTGRSTIFNVPIPEPGETDQYSISVRACNVGGCGPAGTTRVVLTGGDE